MAAPNERVTRGLPTECPECQGLGVTEETEPVRQRVRCDGHTLWVTVRQGSGCPLCHGIGQLFETQPARL
jgi:hypothetical protein